MHGGAVIVVSIQSQRDDLDLIVLLTQHATLIRGRRDTVSSAACFADGDNVKTVRTKGHSSRAERGKEKQKTGISFTAFLLDDLKRASPYLFCQRQDSEARTLV